MILDQVLCTMLQITSFYLNLCVCMASSWLNFYSCHKSVKLFLTLMTARCHTVLFASCYKKVLN